jgi:hypothetical protein
MSSILNNDNFVSVLPRIIDPGMQFTKQSILNSNAKNENQQPVSKSSGSENSVSLEKKEVLDVVQNQKSNSFLSDYKYIIFMVIISIVIIIIVYFIYKYFDNKNNPKTIESSPAKEEIKLLVDKDKKDDNIKEYISNYIIKDEEEDEDEDEDNMYDKEEYNEPNYKKEEVSEVYNKKPIFNSPIIQKPTPIINTELVLDSNLVVDDNVFTSGIDKNIKGGNLESENIDFLLNSLNNTDNNELNDYDADNDSDGDNNIIINDDSDDIPIFEELEDTEKYDSNDEKNNNGGDDDDDDLKYFKKFVQK